MLDQLFEEIKDIDSDEPSAMEKINEYLLNINDEDQEYMQILIDTIGDEEIYWERPWYQLSRSVTRPFKPEDEFEGGGEGTFKKDSFSSDEKAVINKNWKKFVKRYKVPDKPLCFARWRNKDYNRNRCVPEEKARYFVTAYLARGLERNLYHVYRHFVISYGAPMRGPFSNMEKKIMEICFQNDPQNAVTLCSLVLGREPRALYKRLNISLHGKALIKKSMTRKWTLEAATRFLNLLMEITDLPLEELKNRQFEKLVWLKLEKEFDHDSTYLQRFWERNLHVQLFVKGYVRLRKLRKKIYKKLRKSSYKVWTDIRWKEMQKLFPDGYTARFLHRIAYCGLQGFPILKTSLSEALDHGLEKLKKKQRRDKILKNLYLDKKGRLTEIPRKITRSNVKEAPKSEYSQV